MGPAAGAADPIARLHHMSTTAGVGSQEYVAISATAIVALILGVASALALLHYLLLAIPLAGIAFAVTAIRQIHGSNGTQTGRAMAWGGLLLCAAFAGTSVVRQVQSALSERADHKAIESLVQRLDQAIKAGDWGGAYALFTDRFRVEQIPLSQFTEKVSGIRQNQLYGSLTSITTNGRIIVYRGNNTAGSILLFKFDKSAGAVQQTTLFRRTGGHWLIDDLPEMFPHPTQGTPAVPGLPSAPGTAAPSASSPMGPELPPSQ